MERIKVKNRKFKQRRLVLTVIAAVLFAVVLSGCAESSSTAVESVFSLFSIRDSLTEAQTRWVLIGETILVLFLFLLVILLIALFRRYRKTEKRANEASIRERDLMDENEMLDRLSRMRTQFFQNMSHDLKTPLTVISTSVLNALDMLDFEMDKEEMRESLLLAQNEIMRLSRIVDSTLKHTTIQGKYQGAESVNLAALLRKVERTYQAFLERRGNSLKIDAQDTLPRVYGNSDMLINVLANLISNSNRFTRNGEIVISTEIIYIEMDERTKLRFVSITVSDNGSGVNPEILSNMFSRGATDGGSGLGLSICKKAIEAHGGTITAESVTGKGTKVTFSVPVYEKLNYLTQRRVNSI